MSTTIRKVVLAVAAVVVSVGAQASLTTVNFDTLWGDPLPASPAPIPLGDLSGLRFTGATAYRGSMASSQDGGEPSLPAGGMAMNRAPDPSTGDGIPGAVTDLNISLIDPNAYFTSMILDYAISGTTSFILWSGNTAKTPVTLIGGGSSMPWNTGEDLTKYLAGSHVNRIEFYSDSPSLLALDNFQFDTAGGGTPPPTVPEPASYALVALALLAAGGASRRRKA